MPRLLKDIHINEVSSVDRGAGRGVKVMLMKRDFSEKEREHAAETGAAMPGGGFPIENASDIANAIHAIGRAKDPEAAKAHIKRRARALGLTDKLPDTWKRDDSGEIEMTEAELQALVEKAAKTAVEAATAELRTEIAKRDDEITLLKMSDAHKAYMGQCDEATARKFAGMSEPDRDAFMSKNPIKKREAPVTNDELAKRDKQIAAQDEVIKSLRTSLDAIELEKRQAAFKKRAADIGLTEDGDGELMRKAYGGDAEAQAAFEARQAAVRKATEAQLKTSKLFTEFGSARTGSGTAYGEFQALAKALRKTESGLSEQQAFTKVFTDPANAELKARYDSENRPDA